VVHPRLPSGRPDYSRVIACRCSRESLRKEKLNALERFSNLPQPLRTVNFESLSSHGRRGDESSQRRFAWAYEAAKTYAANPKGWLILVGPTGSGKTHLSASVVNEVVGNGRPAHYVVTAELLDRLRAGMSPGTESPYEDLFEQVKNSPLLVMDDFAIESVTGWAREKLEQILNHRYNAQLATMITTDTAVEKLDDPLKARCANHDFCQVLVLEERATSYLERLDSMGLKLLRDMTFQTFDRNRPNLTPEQHLNLEMIYRQAFNFAGSPQGWLVLHGVSGSGKTHLAAAIANYQKQAGHEVVFVSVADLLDYLRSAFSPDSKVSYDELFETVKRVPLLILDGLEGQSTSTWAQEKLYQLMNYRHNAQLPTVITTRLTQDEMDPRIRSRMADPRSNNVLAINAPSYHGEAVTHKEPPPPPRRRPQR